MTSDPTLSAYRGLAPCFGDLHNHCAISYGHGSIEDAFRNARERLDFCSVTGHAFWPDMPAPQPEFQDVIDFHEAGFARLRETWPHAQQVTQAEYAPGRFVTFLGFEMHSGKYGDHTVLYRDGEGEILYSDGLPQLVEKIAALRESGVHVLAFPHHIAYRRGRRGINWAAFDRRFCPVVEIVSMHGCSEADEGTRPFLHSMGPSDHEGTMQHGLALGRVFGVIGSTDHHSAHPGSYGHGLTGLWAAARTREAVWDAILARRTYALTGDRIALEFAINGKPMGAELDPVAWRQIDVHVTGGAPIDCVDLVRNNRLVRRTSECDVPYSPPGATVRTRLLLEVGWGRRGKRVDWDVAFGIADGRILSVEPRFRGPEVVSPLEKSDDLPFCRSHCEQLGERTVRFETITCGNPNNSTPATQGVCLDVDMPVGAAVCAQINGQAIEVPLGRLIEGALAGYLGNISSPAYRFHRAPLPCEFDWTLHHEEASEPAGCDVYYVRVRQKNDQWAWSSPIFIG